MTKRFLAIAAALLISVSMCSCKDKEKDENKEETEQTGISENIGAETVENGAEEKENLPDEQESVKTPVVPDFSTWKNALDASPVKLALRDEAGVVGDKCRYYIAGDKTEVVFVFGTERKIKNFKVFETDFADNFKPTKPICGVSSLDTDEAIIVGVNFWGDFTTYGFAFVDEEENNTVKYYTFNLYLNDEGGVNLAERTPPTGAEEELVTGCYDDIVSPLLVRFSDEASFPGYTGKPETAVLTSGEYRSGVTVYPTEKVTDFKVFSLETSLEDDGMSYGVGKILYEKKEFFEEAVTLEMEFMDMPINGISFKDADGKEKYFAIGMNGLDGNIYFNEFTPDEFVKW